MSKLIRVIAVIFIVIALLLPATTMIQADSQPDGSQIWYLDSNGSGGIANLVPLATNVTTYNLTNETFIWETAPATMPVTFLAGDWTVKLKISAAAGTFVAALLYYADPTNNTIPPVPIGMENWRWQTVSDTGNTFTINSSIGFTVPAGNCLVLAIAGASEIFGLQVFTQIVSSAELTIQIDKDSAGNNQLQSPKTDSGAPLPELPAAALLGIGLTGLGGFVYFRRKAQTESD